MGVCTRSPASPSPDGTRVPPEHRLTVQAQLYFHLYFQSWESTWSLQSPPPPGRFQAGNAVVQSALTVPHHQPPELLTLQNGTSAPCSHCLLKPLLSPRRPPPCSPSL